MEHFRGESAADLAHHLKGLKFPLKKRDMIKRAWQQGADQDVLNQLERLQDKKYDRVAEVMKEIGKVA